MNDKLIAGIAGVAVLALGGLGYRAYKNRSLKKAATEAMAAAVANTDPVVRDKILEKLVLKPAPVMQVEETAVIPEPPTCSGAVLHTKHQDVEPEVPVEAEVEAVISSVEGIHSVSRIRNQEDSVMPSFWQAGIRKIRREDIVQIDHAAFVKGKNDYPRGFHLCNFEGKSGILHVTRSNFSAVVLDEQGEFHGISTSASKFGGRSLSNITHERAKIFLNGN